MKVIIQRVLDATCTVNDTISGSIQKGYTIFVGFHESDNDDDLKYIVNKISKIRLFENNEGRIDYSIIDKKYELLIIPQFTLYANTRKGNRPDFLSAMKPETASINFNLFVSQLKLLGINVETGIFGADMKIMVHNDGPFTIIIDSSERKNGK